MTYYIFIYTCVCHIECESLSNLFPTGHLIGALRAWDSANVQHTSEDIDLPTHLNPKPRPTQRTSAVCDATDPWSALENMAAPAAIRWVDRTTCLSLNSLVPKL